MIERLEHLLQGQSEGVGPVQPQEEVTEREDDQCLSVSEGRCQRREPGSAQQCPATRQEATGISMRLSISLPHSRHQAASCTSVYASSSFM